MPALIVVAARPRDFRASWSLRRRALASLIVVGLGSAASAADRQRDIGGPSAGFVLKDWPEPDNPVSVPWRRIARDFDKAAFTTVPNALGDAPFHWTDVRRWNYPLDSTGFGLDSYFVYNGSGGRVIPEGIVSIGSLVGGTFAGIDYSHKVVLGSDVPTNLVRLAKKYFASTSDANVFLNGIPSVGGGQFWYDIMPNVLACQLASQYGGIADRDAPPEEPTLQSLCLQATDTWYQVTDTLRAGRSLPEFAYQAVQLVPGRTTDKVTRAEKFQPLRLCGTKVWDPHIAVAPDPRTLCLQRETRYTQYQSEAAAGIGYLGLLALEHTGDVKYRQLADWTFGFLDSIAYNPTYECLMPYGAMAAARLNAEYGTRYDLQRYLDWVFSESAVRFFWSMLADTWGGYSVHGLVGEPTRTTVYAHQNRGAPVQGSAASMASMLTAVTLAPIARYQPQYARALGKYLGHVATNARLFYPAYAPYIDAPTASYLARAGEPALKTGMPLEAIQSLNPGRVDREPFATGDALKSGRYKTNLAIYGGFMAGGLAALFNPTNVEGIYQIDLLATDLPRPKAFPTYLFYNPYQTARCVAIDEGRLAGDPRFGGRAAVTYDLVTKAAPPLGACTGQSFSLDAHHAAVIALVPEGDALEARDGRLVSHDEGIVVDYSVGR